MKHGDFPYVVCMFTRPGSFHGQISSPPASSLARVSEPSQRSAPGEPRQSLFFPMSEKRSQSLRKEPANDGCDQFHSMSTSTLILPLQC